MANSSNATAYRAQWIVPVGAPPISDGVITVAAGRIVELGRTSSGPPAIDLGDVVLLPGLVNAHTHLEFSGLAEPLGWPGMEFADWIRLVIERRRGDVATLSPAERSRQRTVAVAAGIAESVAAGVVALGDIASPGGGRPPSNDDIDVTVFLELLGLSAARSGELEALARNHLETSAPDEPPPLKRRGISPHAPYTVRPELVERAARWSAEARFPVAMHLAESFDELELLSSHSGRLVEVLAEFNAWDPTAVPRGIRPRDYLELLMLASRALVIHGNFLTPGDWDLLAERREAMSVVYCPRTQAYFTHGDYPLADMLAAGVRVAAGTDSRATNPDLDLWSDLRWIAAHHPGVSPETVLRLGTLHGAEALGIADEWGSLAVGKRAALATVAVEPNTPDPYARLLDATRCVRVTGGSW